MDWNVEYQKAGENNTAVFPCCYLRGYLLALRGERQQGEPPTRWHYGTALSSEQSLA